MSVNIYDPSTDQLKPISGTNSHLEDEMVAYYEPKSTVSHAYAAGEQFIYDGALCIAKMAINIGDTLVQEINYTLSESITKQIQDVADRPLWNPKGTCVFADLPAIADSKPGDMWNVSDEFTTTSDFREGAGTVVPAGANIYLTSDGKWDVMAGSTVVGVKGDAESNFRKGNVNITPANIGIHEMTPATAATDGAGGTIPAPLAGDENKVFYGDGTWRNPTASQMQGATSTSDGEGGSVPAPLAGQQDRYLKGDGTWGNAVTGIKGNAESDYRTGNVNLTPANIGAYSKSEVDTALNGKLGTSGASTNTTVAFTSNDLAANTTEKTNTTTDQPSSVAKLSSGETLASMFNKISSMFASIRKLWNTVGSTTLDTAYGTTLTAQMANLKSYNTYSTNETWTGEYDIDGKKIYRKSFKILGSGLPTPVATGDYANNYRISNSIISDLYRVKSIDGAFYFKYDSSAPSYRPINTSCIYVNHTWEQAAKLGIYVVLSKLGLNVTIGSTILNYQSTLEVYVNVKYTKTT